MGVSLVLGELSVTGPHIVFLSEKNDNQEKVRPKGQIYTRTSVALVAFVTLVACILSWFLVIE